MNEKEQVGVTGNVQKWAKVCYQNRELIISACNFATIERTRLFAQWGYRSMGEYFQKSLEARRIPHLLLRIGREIQDYTFTQDEIIEIEKYQKNPVSLLLLATNTQSKKGFIKACLTITGRPDMIAKALRRKQGGNGEYGPLPFLSQLGRHQNDREIILSVTNSIKKRYKITPGKAALVPYLLWYTMQLYSPTGRVAQFKKLCQKHSLPANIERIFSDVVTR